jgi:hypothetical protein
LTTAAADATLLVLLLRLKTLTLRLALPVVVLLAWAPVAHAWSWPAHGPVLQPFSYDEAHPYGAGQHRGIDIGADAAGASVVAPAGGTVAFAGTVPTSGKSVTIATADGYSVTLTHLGSILVLEGATIAEGDAVGTVGPSGTPEVDVPYVHLGIRLSADPNGYIDPLGLLPASGVQSPPADDGSAAATQPSASGGSSGTTTTQPATEPDPAPATSASPATTRGTTIQARSGRAAAGTRAHRADTSRPEARGSDASQRPTAHTGAPNAAPPRASVVPERHLNEPRRPSRQRPVVETAARLEPTGRDSGSEIEPSADVAERPLRRSEPASALTTLAWNGAAALVALAAAIAAARGSRRRREGSPVVGAQVVQLSAPASDRCHRNAA